MDDELQALLARQLDLATRQQLRDHGISAAALRWRLGRGWTAVLPGVVRTTRAPLGVRDRLVAACLEGGPASVVTGDHACLVHGLRNAAGNRRVRVLVPVNQDSRDVGFVEVRRTRRPVEHPHLDGAARIAPIGRAVLDAARSSPDARQASALVVEAVQRGLASLDELQHELDSGPRRGSAAARAALGLARAGAWSLPEADLLVLCTSSRVLPHAWPNPRLWSGSRALLSPDVWFDDVALAVMVHSKAHHAREAEWRQTVERDAELTVHGVLVLAVTPSSIAADPRRVLRMVEQAYVQAGRRPRPTGLRMQARGPGLP
ncbi:hypothetical protein GCM10027446_10090 [Angustibacter peucedani]